MKSKWVKRIAWITVFVGLAVLLRFTVLAPKPVPVSVYRVQSGKVEETVTNSKAGTVKARKRSNLSPEIGGRVVFIGAREGERVMAGMLLLRLYDTDYRASLELARRGVQSAQAAQKEACVAADLARREYDRNVKLSEEGIVSAGVLDQASNQRDATSARCEAARAELKRSESAADMAEANLSKTELRAPFDGVVVRLSTELGEYVTPSPPGLPIPPVIDILDDHSIYVEAPMDETDSGRLQPGLPVRISLDPFPDRTFPGKLTRVGSFVQDVEGQNRTVDVEAEFDDPSITAKLLAGTSADVEVILASRDKVLRIPSSALLEGGKVLLVEGNRLVSRAVKTGLRNWEYAEIVDGLKEGDLIVVSLDRAEVKEGARVAVTEEVER